MLSCRRAATSTTTSARPTVSTKRACCAPTGSPGFATPSGRIELVPYATFGAWGIPTRWPEHRGVASVPTRWLARARSSSKEYPFICVNGSRSYEFFHSENRQQATMREFHPVPHQSRCRRPGGRSVRSFNEGEWVWLENTEGRCRQKAHHRPHARSPATSTPSTSWWFPEEEPAFPHLFRGTVGRATSTTSPRPTRRAPAASAMPAQERRLQDLQVSRPRTWPSPRPARSSRSRAASAATTWPGEPYSYGQDRHVATAHEEEVEA